jgi:undecaprenyl-diphosphatase
MTAASMPGGWAALRRHTGLLVGGGVALALAASFVAISQELAEGELVKLDGRVLVAFEAIRTPWRTALALDVTALGSGPVLGMVTTLLTLVFLRMRKPHSACWMVAAAAGAAGWTSLLKHVFERRRPTEVGAIAAATGYSYPSGHSLASAAIYATAAILLAAHARGRADRVLIGACTLCVMAAIGASRIYLGVHYPSDVLAGFCAGLSWALCLAAVASWVERRGRNASA